MTEPETPMNELERLHKVLTDEGVNVNTLMLVMIGDEQLLGEEGLSEVLGSSLTFRLKNPKRLLRLQRLEGDNFSVKFILIDLDLIDEGSITVVPQAYYRLRDLSEVSRVHMLALYETLLSNKKTMRQVASSKIILPRLEMPQGLGAIKSNR
jgi:hypothetical protein